MSTKEILDEVIIACLPCPSLQTLDRRPAIQLDGIRSKSRRVCSAESASCRNYLVAGSSTGREGACKQASAGLCWRAVAVVSSVEVDDFDGLSPASQRELSTKNG